MHVEPLPPPSASSVKRRLKLIGVIAAVLAVLIVAWGSYTRATASKDVAHWTNDASIPAVNVIAPTASESAGALTLPGKLSAYYSASIYARVPGYVTAWYKDIGAQVKKGDVLAVIDTPELDQQIDQAKADLANATAAERLSETTAKRWNDLLALDAVSKQEADEKTSDLAVKTAQVNAADANLARLQALKRFAQIRAPFDGVVTTRSVDVGTLVNAGGDASKAALFTVDDVSHIRVYVDVPQNVSANIVPGVTASLSLSEYPGKTFSAKLDSTSSAISAQSDTLLAQFIADNAQGTLKPGDFATVTINLNAGAKTLSLPASALLFKANGLQVATVGAGDHVVLKPITIAEDRGTTVEVGTGLNAGDRVIDNPPDSLGSGDLVRIANAAAAKPPGATRD